MAAKKKEKQNEKKRKQKQWLIMWEIEKKLFIFLYVEKIGRVGRCKEGRRMQKKGESEWRGKAAKKQKKKKERSGHGFDTRLVFFLLT